MEKPTLKQRADAFVTFLWDSENSKVLGRGGRSWAEIGFFYLIYYICLTSFFAATVAIFYQTIESDTPKLLGDSSLLKGNPGMGFRPMPSLTDVKIVSKKKVGKNKDYVENLNDFLKPYRKSDMQTIDCSTHDSPRPDESTSCEFDLTAIEKACPEKDDYGMMLEKPCVLLKLNKVYDWIPDLWDNAGESDLPDDVKAVYNKTAVPIKCYAKDKDDRDKLGVLSYHPQQGFPVYYFPYKKQKDYLSPLVFVRFNNVTRDDSIKIVCRAYAKNIEYDRQENLGGTEFELEVEK